MPDPRQTRCTECESLAREFQDAWRGDQQELRTRFHQTAQSTGRDPETFLHEWVMSLAQMPDSEFDSLQRAYYPRVDEVRRKWKEHGNLAGHSPIGDGWRAAFIFAAVLRSGYAFLKGGGLR